MKEELLLERKYGKRRPFSVPDGYFDSLGASFDSRLRREKRRGRIVSLCRPVAWAACVVLLLALGFVFFNKYVATSDVHYAKTETVNTKTDSPSESMVYTLNDISDYAMLDNDDIYSYVSEE